MLSPHVAMHYHLTSNHYPPLPSALIEPCFAAIEAAQEGDYQRLIDLPEGLLLRGSHQATAEELVDTCHLDGFIETDDDAVFYEREEVEL